MKSAFSDIDNIESFLLDKDIFSIVTCIGEACIQIADKISNAPIDKLLGSISLNQEQTNASGDIVKQLDQICNDILISKLLDQRSVAMIVSEENQDIISLFPDGKYAVCFDPLDGSSNIDCALPTGTIFGIYSLKNIDGNTLPLSGRSIVAAGYVMYSSSTEMVLAAGHGCVQGFTLNRRNEGCQTFALTRSDIRCPNRGPYYSLNEGRSADWPAGLQKYIDDIKNGRSAWGKRYSSRYVCSLVADLHRTILYGGWAGNPRAHLRLLYEAAPLAFIFEQAGGAASDGKQAILDIVATSLHHRLPVFIGSIDDILEIEKYGDCQQLSNIKYQY